jgi:hypothetical protein
LKKGFSDLPSSIELTRLENCSVPGIPDVLMMDHKKRFHLIELKAHSGNKVRLSPHQIAFGLRHRDANCWLLVKKTGTDSKNFEIFLYKSSEAMELFEQGLADREPWHHQYSPISYSQLYFAMFRDVSHETLKNNHGAP